MYSFSIFLWNEYLIIRATEDLKNSTLWGGHGKIDFSRRADQEYIYLVGSHMSASTSCIHSA